MNITQKLMKSERSSISNYNNTNNSVSIQVNWEEAASPEYCTGNAHFGGEEQNNNTVSK